MTLAYYGKSKQRQALLAIVTFFALAIGVVVAGGFGGLFPAARVQAAAQTIASFNFNGGDQTDIPDWNETESSSSDAERDSNAARLQEGAAMYKTISTVGYKDIVVTFDCKGDDDNDAADDLLVEYTTNGSSWTTFATLNTNVTDSSGCNETSFTARTMDLSAIVAANNNASFGLRFKSVGHADSSEDVNIDNVLVKGAFSAVVGLNSAHLGASNPGFSNDNPTCPTPPAGMAGYWGWHFIAPGNNNFDSLTVKFLTNGTMTDSTPPVFQASPDGSHAYVWTPTADTLSSNAADFSATISGGNPTTSKFNLSHVCPGAAPTGTVIVKKVISGSGSSTSDAFGGTVNGPTNQTFSDLKATQAGTKVYSSQTTGSYTVSETNPGTYTRNGYAVGGGTSAANATCPGSATSNAASSASQTLAASGTIVFCVYNEKQAQVSARTLRVCKEVDDNSGKGGSFTITVSSQTSFVTGNLEPDDSECKDYSVEDGTQVTVNETSGGRPAGWTNVSGYPKYKKGSGSSYTLPVGGVTVTVGEGTCSASQSLSRAVENTTTPPPYDCKVTIINKAEKPVTRTLEVCKEVDEDSNLGGVFTITVDGTEWKPDVAIGKSECKTFEITGDDEITIAETGFPAGWSNVSGYPKSNWDETNGTLPRTITIDKETCRSADDDDHDLTRSLENHEGSQTEEEKADCTFTITNKSERTTKLIQIKKFYQNLNGYTPVAGDLPTFTLNPSVANVPGSACNTVDNGANVVLTCTVPASWNGTVTETPKAGWVQVYDGACSQLLVDRGTLQRLVDNVLSVLVEDQVAIEKTFTFCNRPSRGTVIVKKIVTGDASSPTDPFGGTVSGPTNQSFSDLSANANKVYNSQTTGSYTVAETNVNGYTLLGYSFGYEDGGVVCPNQPVASVSGSASQTLSDGGTIVFCIHNRKDAQVITGTVYVQKVVVGTPISAGDSFGGTLTGKANWALTNGGVATYSGIVIPVAGVSFTANETSMPAHYTNLGYSVVNGTGACPASAAGAASTATLTQANTIARICVYNQAPRGSIEVTKTTVTRHNGGNDVPVPQDRDGWKITISSAACGVGPIVGYTDTNGKVTFNDLLLCNDYSVTEDAGNSGTSGYGVVGSATVTGRTPANPATQVGFTNRKDTADPPCVVGCTPQILSTPTPAPTNTPVPTATAKPTEKPKDDKPIDTALGEKTPGALSTPIAPSTGTGTAGAASTFNGLLALVGLVVLSSGLAIVAVGRKQR